MVEVVEIPFKEEYIPELSTLLGKEYLASNQCFKALNLKEVELIKEFEEYFKNKQYRWLVLLADKKLLAEGKVSFVSVVCGGDLIDYFPKNELSYEKNVDFDLVPTISKFRAYMRFKSLKPFWEKYHPKEGQFVFGTSMFINPVYQGQGNTYKILYFGYKFLASLGYKYLVANVVNDILKPVFRRTHLADPEYQVSLDDMEIQDVKVKPLTGQNLTQSVFLIDLDKTVDVFYNLAFGNKLRPKL